MGPRVGEPRAAAVSERATSRQINIHAQGPIMDDARTPATLNPDLLQKMHAYWRAANYLSVGQIYLQDNPLLEAPLEREHIKPRLLGHWGTTPGLISSTCI